MRKSRVIPIFFIVLLLGFSGCLTTTGNVSQTGPVAPSQTSGNTQPNTTTPDFPSQIPQFGLNLIQKNGTLANGSAIYGDDKELISINVSVEDISNLSQIEHDDLENKLKPPHFSAFSDQKGNFFGEDTCRIWNGYPCFMVWIDNNREITIEESANKSIDGQTVWDTMLSVRQSIS